MNYKQIKSILLVVLTLVGTTLVLVGFVPNLPSLPVVPNAHAAPPSNPGILGLFNEPRKTNAIIDSTIGSGGTFVMDVNVTDAGLMKGFDISINYSSAAITVSAVAWSGTGCPKAAGCLFDGLTVLKNFNGTNSGGNTYRINLGDQDAGTPFVSGTGILFRLTFKTTGVGVASVMHIHSSSLLLNPANIPYSPIDGYVDSKAVPTANYNIAVNPATTTLIRPVSAFQTNATSPALSVQSLHS